MGRRASKNTKLTVIDGENAYIGPERRQDRRRLQQNDRIETLLKNFGLDRRLRTERRRKDTSWLLTSQRVVNE